MPCPQPEDTVSATGPAPTSSSTTAAPPPSDADAAGVGAKKCVRCRTATATVHFRDASYCPPCAKSNFYSKAKLGLEYARGAGIDRFIRRVTASGPVSSDRESVNASLALGFSGGMSSRVLLRAAADYFRPEQGRKKGAAAGGEDEVASGTSTVASLGRTSEVGKVYVVFIDDSAIISGGIDRTEEARRIVASERCEDFEFVGLKLEDVYLANSENDNDDNDGHAAVAVECSAEPGESRMLARTALSVDDRRKALQSLFASLHPESTPRGGVASARTRTEDLHRILVHYLLRREANRRGCSALMLGESGTRMSIRLIESLAKGAGHQLPIESSDAIWIDDLLVTRPLKTLQIQEIKCNAEANELVWLPDQDLVPSAVPPGSAYNASGEPVMDKSSIGRLTETFILNLERGVPSTVSTIGKTGSKLVLKPSSDSAASSDPQSSDRGTAANASSVSSPNPTVAVPAFEQVGPSEPLLGRKARKAAARAKEAAASGSSMVLEPRVGARGSRLAHSARILPRWDGRRSRRACPLCYMPAGAGAKDWKNEITISTLSGFEGEERRGATSTQSSAQVDVGGRIELASLLCYACILVLDTPERPLLVSQSGPAGASRGGATMPLPPYVLAEALYRLSPPDSRRSEGESGAMVEHDPALLDGEDPVDASADAERRQMAAATPREGERVRRVGRDEMRQKIDEFLLLDDAGGEGEV